MNVISTLRLGLPVLLLAAMDLNARNVFLLPGATATATTQVYSQDPLSQVGSFQGTAGVFAVFTVTNGSKYYLISSSTIDSIVIVDSTFTNILQRISLPVPPVSAALSPDGNRLLVVGGGLRIFNTVTDTEFVPLAPFDVGPQPVAVAVNHESTRAFVAAAGRMTAIDLVTNSVLSPVVPILGAPTGLVVAPTNVVYITAINRIFEINGRTLSVNAEIAVNARPGPLEFTPDGRFAIAVNQTPATGSPVVLLDVVNRTTSMPVPAIGAVLDRIIVTGDNRAYATNQSRQLLVMQLNPFTLDVANFQGVGSLTAVAAIAATEEAPSRYLFASTSNTVFRIDAGTNNIVGSVQTPIGVANLAVAGPANTGTAASVLQFNHTQNIAATVAPQPLIFRALGINREPLSGVVGTLSTTTAGVTFLQPSVTTNNRGYGVAFVTVATTAGTYTVQLTVGNSVLTYTLNVSGGITPGVGGITIVSGNGQGVREQFLSAPLVVLVTLPDGTPAKSSPITWAVTAGIGTLVQADMTTDDKGMAKTLFLASNVLPGLSYQTQTVSANSVAGTANFVITSLVSILPNGQFAGSPTVQILDPPLAVGSLAGRAGDTLPGAIRVLVVATSGGQTGQPIPNISVNISTGLQATVGPTATCAGGTALTEQSGIATCDVVLGGKPGMAQITISVGLFVDMPPIPLRVDPGLPAIATILQGNNQTGNAGQLLPLALRARISDRADNALTAIPVQWEIVTPGSLRLTNVVAISDSNGFVSALVELGNTSGTFQVRVRSTIGPASAVFNVTVVIPVGGIVPVSGDGQTAFIGQQFGQPVVVRVNNLQGVATAGLPVSFAVTAGAGSVSPSSAVTNSQGQASATVVAGPTAGRIVITATVAGFSTSFTLTSRVPGPQFAAASFVNSAGFQTGAVVACGIYNINARGIAPGLQGIVQGSTLPGLALPTVLRNVRALFGGAAAPIFLIRNDGTTESMTVQVPCEITGTEVSVQIFVGDVSTTMTVPVALAQPGIFQQTGADGVPFAILIKADGSIADDNNPVVRGEKVTMVVTALGQTTPPAVTNRVGVAGQTVALPLIAGVNDAGVLIVSAVYGSVPGFYEVSIDVPLDTAPGRRVNLGLAAILADGSVIFANGTTFPLR